MSNTVSERIPYFISNDRETLLWDSAHILDNEDHHKASRAVEWTDNEGRTCHLTSKAFGDTHHIEWPDHYYGKVRYIFTRHDPTQNITRTYFIESDKKKKIKQFDQDMKVLPVQNRLAQKAVIESIFESYDQFMYTVMTDEEEKAFYEIVTELQKDILWKFGRATRNIAERIW